MDNIEIEMRIQLERPDVFLRWLKESAEPKNSSNQTDFYFEPQDKPFIYIDSDGYKNADKWLRVRIGDKNEICYKRWYRDKNSHKSLYADEIEVAIENGKKIIEILKNSGFRQIAVVKKHRESWDYKDFRFDCDKVEDLGFFVEIEFKGKIDNPKSGREKIIDLLKEIGIKNWKIIKGGYPWMQWNLNKDYFENEN